MDLERKIEELLSLKATYEGVADKLVVELIDGTPADITLEEKECFARYGALREEVEALILDHGLVVSDNPRVRQYIKESVAARLKEINDHDGQIEPDEEHRLLYSWFSPWLYCERYLALGHLITRYHIPERLGEMIEEARRSYALGHYTAAVAVSRAMFEKAFTDFAVGMRRIPPPKKADYFREYPPYKRLDKLVGKRNVLRDSMEKFYAEASAVIHGSTSPNEKEALALLEQAMSFISTLVNRYTPKVK